MSTTAGTECPLCGLLTSLQDLDWPSKVIEGLIVWTFCENLLLLIVFLNFNDSVLLLMMIVQFGLMIDYRFGGRDVLAIRRIPSLRGVRD